MAKYQAPLGMGTLLVNKVIGKQTLLTGPMALADGTKAYLSAIGNAKQGYDVTVKAIADSGNVWPTLAEFKLLPFGKAPKQVIETPELGVLVAFVGTTRADEKCIRVNQRNAVQL